jgi:hypothetical protein
MSRKTLFRKWLILLRIPKKLKFFGKMLSKKGYFRQKKRALPSVEEQHPQVSIDMRPGTPPDCTEAVNRFSSCLYLKCLCNIHPNSS